MIHTEKTVRTLQAVAMTVGLAVFLWSTGLPTLFLNVEAASITSASDTLTDSNPSSDSVHTLAFTTPNGMIINGTFEIALDAAFDTASLVLGDVSMTVGGIATTTALSSGNGIWGVANVGNDTMTFTAPDDIGVASSTEIIITFGDEAGTMIANPGSTNSYTIDIGQGGSTMQDSGQVIVAIVDEVTVSASVDTSLTFTVSGVGSGQTVNGSPTTTVAASTATTLPFGTLTIDSSDTLAHDLTVATNAKNGYSVTVSLSGGLQSSTGAIIDSFTNGTDLAVPGDWSGPSSLVGQDKTYGHWGVTSDDPDAGRGDEFTSDKWAGMATSSPTIVMGHTGPADGSTADIGANRVGYQIEISALQEAGDDYNTTLRYIATPTF